VEQRNLLQMYSLYHSKSCNQQQQVCVVAFGQASPQPFPFPGRLRAHIHQTGQRRKQTTVHSYCMIRPYTSWLPLLGRSRPAADLASVPAQLAWTWQDLQLSPMTPIPTRSGWSRLIQEIKTLFGYYNAVSSALSRRQRVSMCTPSFLLRRCTSETR
jgi:hypothetical protein